MSLTLLLFHSTLLLKHFLKEFLRVSSEPSVKGRHERTVVPVPLTLRSSDSRPAAWNRNHLQNSHLVIVQTTATRPRTTAWYFAPVELSKHIRSRQVETVSCVYPVHGGRLIVWELSVQMSTNCSNKNYSLVSGSVELSRIKLKQTNWTLIDLCDVVSNDFYEPPLFFSAR